MQQGCIPRARPIKRPSSRRGGPAADAARGPCRCMGTAQGPRRAGPAIAQAAWLVPRPGFEPGRTGQGPADFLTSTAFAARGQGHGSGSGARLHHAGRQAGAGARRPLSTPSTRGLAAGAWLGVASQRPGPCRGFAEFDGIHAGRFRAGCSMTQVRCVCLFRHRGDADRMVAAPSGAAVAHRRPARLRAIVSSSVKRRERVRKALPSGPSSEKVPPWPPSTTSMMSWVCFQYSYCWAPM